MQTKQFPNKILWLASYPKSGNTWFRTFLTALQTEGDINLNNLITDGIFASRLIFDDYSDIDSQHLYDYEAKTMIADVFRYYAQECDRLSVFKIHDTFTKGVDGNYIVPEDCTHCSIYFIRNPLDIAGSLANHNNSTIQMAVNTINNKKSCLASQPGNLNITPQFRQDICDWSTHVNSWSIETKFPVIVVRYEDMVSDTFATFTKLLKFVGWDYAESQIKRAIEATSFDKLKQIEATKGFKEKPVKAQHFFRSGISGRWKEELTTEQICSIIDMHGEVMKRYNYLQI